MLMSDPKHRWLLLLFCVVTAVGCGQQSAPSKYLIPHDYEGVVVTVYDQAGFPPLPVSDGYIVHRYPPDGILITSSSMEYGRGEVVVEDLLPDGDTRPLPGRLSTGRRERFAATGTSAGYGLVKLNYSFMAVGSDEFWADRNAQEYDSKLKEARKKLKHPQKPAVAEER